MLNTQELLKREQVAEEVKWKLEDIFASNDEWEKVFSEVKSSYDQILQYKGKLSEAETLKACLSFKDEIYQKYNALFVYAKMRLDENTANSTYQALTSRISQLGSDISSAFSFIAPEILSISDEQLSSLMQNETLKFYHKYLEMLVHVKPHTLSKEEEALLAQLGIVLDGASNAFGMLNNADLKFPTIKDENGNDVQITHGRYIQFLQSKDRRVRKDAFEAVYATYSSLKNTIGTLFSNNVQKNVQVAKIKKYSSALESALYPDNLPQSVYDSLIEAIHEKLPLMHRYIGLRKKMLGVDEHHMYDLFAPIVENFNMEISYEEAKKLTKESLQPLGETYLNALEDGFANGWIDVYENEGKRSGAYSWGTYGVHPYVLLNHRDDLNSMFTLTHEMGHALHSYFSHKAQPYLYAHYTIFLAEVASTFNESLLIHYLLNKSNDKKEKLYLLNYYIEQFRTTVFRQTMFAEFEKIVHQKAEEGTPITHELLSDIYYKLNVKYHGPEMVVDKDIAMEWARVPHFYRSFYVFKYATGFAAAVSLSKQVLEEGQPALDRYFGFLQAGGSDYSLEILKKAGVDMSTPEPIIQSLDVFEQLINQMEQLINE